MENYFYIDTDGQKQGPVSREQLFSLVAQGIITPETTTEKKVGANVYTRPAWELPGLFPEYSAKKSPQEWSTPPTSSTSSWQFNFASHLWTCRTIKVINGVVAVLSGFVMTLWLIQLFGQASHLPLPQNAVPLVSIVTLFGIVGTWVFVAIQMLAVNMICNWSLVTSRASQLYLERCEMEQNK